MTRRIAFLIEEQNLEPANILALTFTRAAARELRERLERLLGVDTGDRPTVSTLHAFALRQLLRNQGAPNLPHPIRIADDVEERWIIQEELKNLTDLHVNQVKSEFQNLASDWETLRADEDEWERRHPNPRFIGAWRHQRRVYGYTLRAELVYGLKKALDEDPNFELEPHFSHVVVDEYQDLNRCELAVIERSVERGQELFVAGDDDQSIYGFRNAFPLGLREFGDTYPAAEDGELEECHRCDRDILALALAVAEQDTERIAKELHCREDAGDGEVHTYRFASISAEARGIAQLCHDLTEDEGVEPGRILILLRNDPQRTYSTPIVGALEDGGLEVELPSDPFALLDEGRPRELLCILRLLRNRTDDLAWRGLLQLRDNGIGAGTLFRLYQLADQRGERYHQTLQAVAADPEELGGHMRNRLADEIGEVDELLNQLAPTLDEDVETGLEHVLDALEYLEGEERDAVVELLTGLDLGEEATLGGVEQAIIAARGAPEEKGESQEGGGECVRIMTMHSAKGLTADAVIVAGCDDELIPGNTSNRRELDDQRRLLYVSLTRARHFLYITYATLRMGRQSHMLGVSERRHLTQFLRDYVTPEDL
jgi:DNA helicase-2/ATP-dependent DNA helicase PcrA